MLSDDLELPIRKEQATGPAADYLESRKEAGSPECFEDKVSALPPAPSLELQELFRFIDEEMRKIVHGPLV